jgi:hypothetical protein
LIRLTRGIRSLTDDVLRSTKIVLSVLWGTFPPWLYPRFELNQCKSTDCIRPWLHSPAKRDNALSKERPDYRYSSITSQYCYLFALSWFVRKPAKRVKGLRRLSFTRSISSQRQGPLIINTISFQKKFYGSAGSISTKIHFAVL